MPSGDPGGVMLLSIEPDGPVPIYQQIRDRIVEAIARGRQPAGSAPPSTRQLAVDLAVTFPTVNKGYALLRQEGLLRLGRKSGAVVRRDAGSGPPDPGWAQDWAGRLRTLLAEAAAQGMPATGIVRGCQAAMADFDFPAAAAEAGDRGRRHPPGCPGCHGGLRLPRRGGGGGEPKGNPAMSAGGLSAVSPVLVVGALTCLAPAASRPTVQFGVRVPRERAGAPVIRRERRAYYWRTAAIGVCCTVAAATVTVQGYGSWWLPRIILLPELAADLGCFWVARRKIAAVKNADEWFAGLRQTIVSDTSWRTDPPRFPVRWLIPALAVMAAT